MKTQEKSVVIDKNYVPRVGDVLSNATHPLVIVERVYTLPKRSSRVNKNYNDHLFKHEALKKIIKRKEIIWEQHKFDYRLFPEQNVSHLLSRSNRKNLFYSVYLFYTNPEQYKRLYTSNYRYSPQRRNRVIIGKKTMVTINHGLCFKIYNSREKTPCLAWYRRYSVPLSYLINQKYAYQGNIYEICNIQIG
jgi:hypothetical protein